MGMNMIITLIMGITMSTILGTAIAPSIIESTKVTKVQTETINNQEVIFEEIKRYITMQQKTKKKMDDLFKFNYIDPKVNDNGFGGGYEIVVDKASGVATITTEIKDPKAQEIFLKSFKGTSKPSYKVDEYGTWDTNKFETKYVIPNDIMHGNALLMTGIPIGSREPDSNTNKYWYNTSSGKAILKVYDNDSSSWTEVNLGMGNSPDDNMYFIAGDLQILKLQGVRVNEEKNIGMYTKEYKLYEIIPFKPGSFNFNIRAGGWLPWEDIWGKPIVEVRINGNKLDYINFVYSGNNLSTFSNRQTIFFKANDKIEIILINKLVDDNSYDHLTMYNEIYSFDIFVSPGSAGPGHLKYTVFTYE